MTTREATDSYRFQAEIRQLLQILVHSLYQDREIFLRELISNASDALTQMHFHMLTDRNVHDADAELAIHLQVEERDGEKWLIVKDSGIGMTRDELIQNLGTIAQSGARSFLERLKESDSSPGDIIGQFGVGFYSVFMVAEEVRVVSRSYQPDGEAAVWISSGDDSFRVEAAEKSERGTEIQIRLKDDAQEFASEWRLQEIVKRHSDFVSYPIYLDGEQINQQQPLWRKSPSEATDEEYKNFYQQMTMDFQEPLATVHFHSDAPVHVRALLFVPASRDRGVLAARKEPGIKLYSHNVLIQEYNTDLLPKWLEFVDGVVDSEDLPLNVSRETVQSNRFMRSLGKTLRRRLTRTLEEMAREDAEKYNRFWTQQSRTIKEGMVTDPAAVKDVLPLLRFYSSKSEEQLVSLDEYIERMPPEQESIYYVLGDSVAAVAHSPHLDPFQARGIEVLYWVDPLDPFVAPLLNEYNEKPFKNIDDAGLELPEIEEAEEAQDEETALSEPELNRLIGRFVTVLGDRVVEVRASKLLKRSPIRLVTPEGTAGREMERIYRLMGQEYEVPKRILEINARHPLVISLAHLVSNQPHAAINDLAIEQLYAGALLREGLHPDPAEMLPRIEQLLEIAAQHELGAQGAELAGDIDQADEEE
jgi:molecular chaperone HtpG